MKKIIVLMIVAACIIKCRHHSSHKKTIHKEVIEKEKGTHETEEYIFFIPFTLYKGMPP
jgi:hypothetical protein